VHALSGASYRVAGAVAEAFDADLVLQVTSLADCDAIGSSMWDRLSPPQAEPNDKLESPPHIRFLVFTQPLLTVLEEQLKIPVERVDLVRPGVLASQNVACFADPERTVTILCTSALERGSGVDSLIGAVDILRNRGCDLLLFLLGRGRQEPSLRSMVHDRRLSSCVTMARPAGDLARAMHGADIFVRPSVDTAFSDDGLLAMGAGMAVVTLPSSVCDYYRGNETAVVCDKPTAESLAGVIEGLLNDRAEARRIAAAGMEYVRAHHAVSSMAQHTADAYRKLALARATFPIRE
jgi:glycosyltransferase involved in cell wall biosynthesis